MLGKSRSRWFGVDWARFTWPDPAYPTDLTSCEQYGSFFDVLIDLANLGAACFREPMSSDLLWHHMFRFETNGPSGVPGKIPKPAEILTNMRADNYWVFSKFSFVLLCVIRLRLRYFPTVFARGGGEGLNSDAHDDKTILIFDPTVPDAIGRAQQAEATWEEVLAGKPAHQVSALIPCVWGWNEWYWHPDEMTVVDPPDMSDLYNPDPVGVFQRYVLNVHNAMDELTNRDVPARADTYSGLCAMRKSLALAAFGTAVGEVMQIWENGLAAEGLAIADYVPHLEFGAENDEDWAQFGEWDSHGMLTEPQLTELEDDPHFRASWREYARFHGTLGRAIIAEWPAARFKSSESASWATILQSKARSDWMGIALTDGLDAEAELMRRVVTVRTAGSAWTPSPGYEAAEDWVGVEQSAGFAFPRAVQRFWPPQLVHVIGLHWFHYWKGAGDDPEDPHFSGDLGYQNESEMIANTLDPLLELVVARCEAAGRPVTWGIGNVGFPSGATTPGHGLAHVCIYDPPGQMQEAQSLVRQLLTIWAYGADHVMWFNHMCDRGPDGGGQFGTMGLRNDEVTATVGAAAVEGWAKSAWWALQCLIQLTMPATTREVHHDDSGLIAVRLRARAGFTHPRRPNENWEYAHIFWLDGGRLAVPYASASIVLGAPDGFERVALVPGETGPGVGRLGGYRASTDPEWDDDDPSSSRYGNCTQEWIWDGDSLEIEISKTFGGHPLTGTRAPGLLNWVSPNWGIVAWLTNSKTCKIFGRRTS